MLSKALVSTLPTFAFISTSLALMLFKALVSTSPTFALTVTVCSFFTPNDLNQFPIPSSKFAPAWTIDTVISFLLGKLSIVLLADSISSLPVAFWVNVCVFSPSNNPANHSPALLTKSEPVAFWIKDWIFSPTSKASHVAFAVANIFPPVTSWIKDWIFSPTLIPSQVDLAFWSNSLPVAFWIKDWIFSPTFIPSQADLAFWSNSLPVAFCSRVWVFSSLGDIKSHILVNVPIKSPPITLPINDKTFSPVSISSHSFDTSFIAEVSVFPTSALILNLAITSSSVILNVSAILLIVSLERVPVFNISAWASISKSISWVSTSPSAIISSINSDIGSGWLTFALTKYSTSISFPLAKSSVICI